MAADQKIGGIFVELITKNWERFKNLILELKKPTKEFHDRMESLAQTADRVGGKFRNALLATAGIVGGFLAAADPGGMGVLGMKAEILARSIGRIFIPIEGKVSAILDRVTNFFNTLSPQMQDVIANTVTWGGTLAGVGWILSGIAKTFATIMSLGAFGKWGLIIGGIAAAIYGVFKAGEWIADKINGKKTAPQQAIGPYNRQFMGVSDAFRSLNTAKGQDIMATNQEKIEYLRQIAENTKPRQNGLFDNAFGMNDNQGLMLA